MTAVATVLLVCVLLYTRPLRLARALRLTHNQPPTILYAADRVTAESLPEDERSHFAAVEADLVELGFVSHGLFARVPPVGKFVTTRSVQLFLTHPESGAICDVGILEAQGGKRGLKRKVVIFHTDFKDGQQVVVSNSIGGAACKGMKFRVGVGVDGEDDVTALYRLHCRLVAGTGLKAIKYAVDDPLALVERLHDQSLQDLVDAGLMRWNPARTAYSKTWRGTLSFVLPLVEPWKGLIRSYRQRKGHRAMRG